MKAEPLPTLQELHRAHRDATAAGDEAAARRALGQVLLTVSSNLDATARSFVSALRPYDAALLDRIKQAGRLAALPALQRYDPAAPVSFLTYLWMRMEAAMTVEAARIAELPDVAAVAQEAAPCESA